MELMPPIHLAVERELTIAKRKAPVSLPGSDVVGQHATHREEAVVSNDAAAKVHHAATLSLYASAAFGKPLDGVATGFVGNERLQVLLRIASRQIEQGDTVKTGNVGLGIEKDDVLEAVDNLLVNEGERLRIPGD
jgi:hypothetical protein